MPTPDAHPDRAGVLVVEGNAFAAIERVLGGERYWVVPGGAVEDGETVQDAALREAQEELGVEVVLGPLRIRLDHALLDGSRQRQWYFEASVASRDIRVVGPECSHGEDRGTYRAVWLPLDELTAYDLRPRAIGRDLYERGAAWPDHTIMLDEW